MIEKGEFGSDAPACTVGDVADILVACEDNGSFVAGLLARAVSNHEYGLPGRCS
jgi:hypothetical protein